VVVGLKGGWVGDEGLGGDGFWEGRVLSILLPPICILQ
jgi:hypothetical protein